MLRSLFLTLAILTGPLTGAARLMAQVPPEKALATMKAGDGLQVELFAAEPMVINPTNMDIDPLGRVWVTEAVNYRNKMHGKPLNRPEGDRIVILADTKGTGKADEATVFYQGKEIYGPLGICVVPFPNKKAKNGMGFRVLVSQSPDILEFTDSKGVGKADGPPKVFLTGFKGVDHDHGVHKIQVGPDGKFYFTVGDQGVKDLQSTDGKGRKWTSNTTDCRAGTIWRCDPDGKNLELVAHNFRNHYEVCIDSFGEIWCSDNDDDGNQQTRICFVMPGGNYGYHPRNKGDHHWHEDQPGVVPKVLRTGFGSPTGICFYEGTLLPEKYRGELIEADAGPREVRSYKRIPKGAGYELVNSLMLTSTDTWFRPSDVSVAPDGSVFVADWYDPGVGGHGMGDWTRGRIYRITPAGHKGYKTILSNSNIDTGLLSSFFSPCIASRTFALNQVIDDRNKYESIAEAVSGKTDYTDGKDIMKMSHSARVYMCGAAVWINNDEDLTKVAQLVDLLLDKGFGQHRVLSIRMLQYLDSYIKNKTDRVGKGVTLDLFNKAKAPLEINDINWALLRENILAMRFAIPENITEGFYRAAKEYNGQDRFYLAALNIACGSDPARRDAILAEFDKHFPEWNDKVADLVWELRPKVMLPKLEGYLKDAKLTPAQKARIVEILAGNDDPAAGKSLVSVLAADAPPEVKAKALASLKLFLPTKWRALAESKELYDAIKGLMNDGKTRITGLQLIAAANDIEWVRDAAMYADDKSDTAVRLEAVRTLGQLPCLKAVETLIRLARPENADCLACFAALGQHLALGVKPAPGFYEALEFLKQTMKNETATLEMKAAAIASLAGNKDGTEFLLAMQSKKELPPELVPTAGILLRNSPFNGVPAKAKPLFPAVAKLDLAKLPGNAALAKLTGNASNGKKVFLASFKGEAQCMKCHMIHKEGGAIGPDLSAIGKKASRENLFESILQPSKAIADQYVTWKVDTEDGQSITGLMVKETPTEWTLRDANGKDYILPAKGSERKKLPTSLMPEDIAKALTEQELIDLVEYLFSLKE